jgi:Flp pilus assembly protein TadD
MHKLGNVAITFFLLLTLCVALTRDLRCYAQTAGAYDQKNNMGMAKKFRAQGEDLQKKGQLAGAIEKYEQGQNYYPDATLAGHIKMLRNTLAKQYMETAKKLRAQGEDLQKKGRLAGAIEKYEQGQAYYYDPKLDEHISALQDTLYLSKKPRFELNGEPEGFREELTVMERLRKDPGRSNMEALAALRYQYALNLMKTAAKDNNEDKEKLALVYAKSATELAPKNPDYWSFLGQLYDRIGGGNELTEMMAEDALQKAVELNPGDNKLRLLLGQSLNRHRRFSSALGQFETVLKKDPRLVSPPTIATICTAYILDAQYSRGVIFFKEILEKQSDADSARIALAILVRQQKNSRQAMEELDKIIKRTDASEENRKYALILLEEWKNEEVKP